MPDDIAHLYDEFLEELLGPEGAAEQRFKDHQLYETNEPRGRRTLRCLVFGCKIAGACAWWPRCDQCNGRCKRCGRGAMPTATIRRDDA